MTELTEVTVAYVFIKTVIGKTLQVASDVSNLKPEVHWVSVITGPYDLLAGVRVTDNIALGDLVMTKIHPIEGVLETSTSILAGYFNGGERGIVDNGPP
jgi:DNA-binding Lrp family transcriptional regulator